jgi:acetyl esterase
MSTRAAAFVTAATAAILARARAAPAFDYAAMEMAEARALFARNNAYWNRLEVPLPEIREMSLPGPAGAMRARLYRPQGGTSALPVLLYVHGGGWTFGDVDSHDRCMRILAQESGAAVLGFDYRLAPEHPFPAALDDTRAALAWIRAHGARSGLDAGRIAIGGDSAGANIALAALAAERDGGAPALAGATLFYGCYAPLHDTESHRRFGGGDFVLSTSRMRWYWRNYLGDLPEDTTALAVPLRADLRGLPRLFLNAAGLDPLLDDTILLAGRLAHAGTPYELDLVPGVIHGCMQQTAEEPAAAASLSRAATYLARALAR